MQSMLRWWRGLKPAQSQMIERAHAHGIRVIGATILPYGGSNYYHPGPKNEADRQAVNAWIARRVILMQWWTSIS